MGYQEGLKGENHFMAMMNEKGMPYVYKDDWYDFEVMNQKVEVKSCRLAVRHSERNNIERFQIGRFDFTEADNRESQWKENIWICFIVRHYEQFICLGFIKAKDITVKKRTQRKKKGLKETRYISIIAARGLEMLNFENWIKEVNRYEKKKVE